MKKTAIALSLVITLLCSMLVMTLFVNFGKANPFPMAGIEIALKNPQNITYNDNTISLVFTATEVHLRSGISFSYVLDNQERKPVLNVTTVSEEMFPSNPPSYIKTMSGNLLLFNLSEGRHKISVYCQTFEQSQSYSDDDSIDFFVDTIPIISILPYENMTFVSSQVRLNFTVNQPSSKITYSLDGGENITILENLILTELANGQHNITVYAFDLAGNIGKSELTFFVVQQPEPIKSESFPLTNILIIIIVITLTISFYLIFFRRHRKTNLVKKR
jgi:hypothetical protein